MKETSDSENLNEKKVFASAEEEIVFYKQKYDKQKTRYGYLDEIHKNLRKDYSELLLKYESINDELKIEKQLRKKYEDDNIDKHTKITELRNSFEKEKEKNALKSASSQNNNFIVNNFNNLNNINRYPGLEVTYII